MKKVLSIMLALMLIVGAIACTQGQPAAATATDAPKTEPVVTDAPKTEPEPEPEPAAETAYVALGLTIKNKSGKTIDELYIYPTGGELGNSVVAKGWPTKGEGDGYEQNIYIVRPDGAQMSVLAVTADGEKIEKDVGALVMFTEIKFEKDGVETEVEDKAEDQAAIAAVVLAGMTADRTYPGYIAIGLELKNKTNKVDAKTFTEFYFYEKDTDPKAYNNMIPYLEREDGTAVADGWMPGKAKEGGFYPFGFFLRPYAQDYSILGVFSDGTSFVWNTDDLEGTGGWWKLDKDHQKNEISLGDPTDNLSPDNKYQWDDGNDDDYGWTVDERLDFEINVGGIPLDHWYPTYPGAEGLTADAEAIAAVQAEQKAARKAAVNAKLGISEEPAEEPVEVVPAEQPVVAAAGEVIGLNIKNKTGVTINEVYIYAKGDSLVAPGWQDKDVDKDNYEKNVVITCPAGVPLEVYVVFEDGETATWAVGELKMYDKLSMKKGTDVSKWECEPEDDPEVIAAIDALVAAAVPAA